MRPAQKAPPLIAAPGSLGILGRRIWVYPTRSDIVGT